MKGPSISPPSSLLSEHVVADWSMFCRRRKEVIRFVRNIAIFQFDTCCKVSCYYHHSPASNTFVLPFVPHSPPPTTGFATSHKLESCGGYKKTFL